MPETQSKPLRGLIVLGPYRSGTSMTSKLLQTLGVNFGPNNEMARATIYNPNGYFERFDINIANDHYIDSAGGTLEHTGEPQQLRDQGNPRFLSELNLDWLNDGQPWGIKDPRMCSTLLSWIEHGIIDREGLGIVRVSRDLDAATRSAMSDPWMRAVINDDADRMRTMLATYRRMADWHVDQLGLPVARFTYEEVARDPVSQVQRLATFAGCHDLSRIRRAARVVNKPRALRRYHVHRWIVRAPRSLLRRLLGRPAGVRPPKPPHKK